MKCNTDNHAFLEALKKSGLTAYSLAQRTGISYTTISELKSGKRSINHCSYEMVCKMAYALHIDMQELCNPVFILEGVQGHYRGLHYTWHNDTDTYLSFSYQGEPVELHGQTLLTVPWDYMIYQKLAEIRIDQFLYEKELDRRIDSLTRDIGI